jgi:hypothetical protein
MAIWRILICAIALATPAWAEDTALRWKFTSGDSQQYRMTQTARMNLLVGGDNEVAAEVHRVFDFLWSVESVAADGLATISVKMTRVQLRVTGSGEQKTQYDTQGDEQAGGFAATLAPLFKTLLKSELKSQMNPRGELSDLQIPEDLQILLSSKPAGKAVGQLGSKDDFRSLLKLGLPTLPVSESFAEGQQWEEDHKLEDVSLGSTIAHTIYRWESTKQDEQQRIAVIAPVTTIRLKANEPSDEDNLIADQETNGEILFNLTSGRLESSQVEMKLKLDSVRGGQSASGAIEHMLKFERLDGAELD